MKENKYFPYLVAIAAFTISFSAAFYSIFGIGKMFAGASTNVMIMAGSLEFAKLVIASLLYRFWDEINKALRLYLTIACFVLIVITSAGIYGFLSSAYQETANKIENVDKNSAVIEKKKEMPQRELDQYEKQLEFKSTRQNTISDMRNRQQSNIDDLISKNRSVSAVRTQMNQLGVESKQLDEDIRILQDSIGSKTEQINQLDLSILDLSTNNDIANEIGPLKYIANITGKSLDTVVNWFIVALMLVFDPLAIALVVASNFIFSYIAEKKKEEEKNEKKIESEENSIKIPLHEKGDDDLLIDDEENFLIDSKIDQDPIAVKEEPVTISKWVEDLAEIGKEKEDIHSLEPKKEEIPVRKFIIGNTPVRENKEEPVIAKENLTEENLVFSPDIPVEERISSIEGDFGGYKLGNVYKKEKKSIKDYENKRDIPIELLIHKEDPTRL